MVLVWCLPTEGTRSVQWARVELVAVGIAELERSLGSSVRDESKKGLLVGQVRLVMQICGREEPGVCEKNGQNWLRLVQ